MFLRLPKETNYSIQNTVENCFTLSNVFVFKKMTSLENNVFWKAKKGARRDMISLSMRWIHSKPFCKDGLFIGHILDFLSFLMIK